MEIYLKEAANKKSSLRFPSLPDKEITVKGNAKYQKYDVIKQGVFAFPAGPDIRSYEWSGYFWGRARKKMSIIHTKWLDPKSVIKKLENWRDKGTVLNLIISAGGGINTDVTIQNFEYKKFGGKGDYSYSISFYRYRPLKIQTTKDLGIDKKKKKTTTRTNLKKSSTDKKKQTYTIKSGDCLWNIAKKFYGSGADWKKIYDANKTAIEKAAKKYGHKDSDQGDWIFPGTILTIP